MAKCGQCDFSGSFEEYLEHKCTDGYNPTQPEHLGPEFAAVQEAALARGEARKAEEAKGKKTKTK